MTKKLAVHCCCLCALLLIAGPTWAGWSEMLDFFKKSDTSETAVAGLSEDKVIAGLKQALQQGSQAAIQQLGKQDGFFRHPQLRIPLPDQLQKVESGLRSLKQDKLADDFVLAMNRAAEQAVPAASDILIGIVSKMSVQDAYAILNGPDDAATTYLREKGGDDLKREFLPVVSQATDRVGVTRHYKSMIDGLGMMSALVDTDSLDIDNYVTDSAIDGLFQLIASEERLIREDPAARTTDLLKQVFGYTKN